MRVFHVLPDQLVELSALHELPESLPDQGFIWIGSGRREFELRSAELHAALQRWTAGPLVDLHVSDLLNNHLPSHFDYTSWYDLMVFRRLAAGAGSQDRTSVRGPRSPAGLGHPRSASSDCFSFHTASVIDTWYV